MISHLLIAILNFVAVAVNVKAMTLQYKNSGKVNNLSLVAAIVCMLIGLFMIIQLIIEHA